MGGVFGWKGIGKGKLVGLTIISPRPPEPDLPKSGIQKMKVKRGMCDFDKIFNPHLQASFLYFSSFDFSVS